MSEQPAAMRGFYDLLLTFGEQFQAPLRGPWGDWVPQAAAGPSSLKTAGEARSIVTPVRAATREWTAWLFGELMQYRGRRAATATLLTGFLEEADDARHDPAELNGHFILLARHEPSRRWHLWTDRLGTMHVYAVGGKSLRALGTYYRSLSGASRRQLDWPGLASYFAFGYFAGDRTWFDDIRIVRPAIHMVIDDSGGVLSESRYWEWSHAPETSRSYRDTVAAFGETLEEILEDECANGRLALPISSGLDSRTVAAVVSSPKFRSRVKPQIWSYSYGYTPYSNETAIARKIARKRRLPFEAFVVPQYLPQRLDQLMRAVEGFQNITSTRQTAVTDRIAANADWLLAAHWGDVWMDEMGFAGAAPGSVGLESLVSQAWKKVAKKGREWLLEHVVGDRLANHDEVLREMLRSELARTSHIADADFRVKIYKTEQWSFRWTLASVRAFQPGAALRLCFYDNRMVDLCRTIPTEMVAGRQLQIDYLKWHHPDLARITWDVTDTSLFFPRRFVPLLLPKRALKKLWRGVTGRKHVGRNWEMQLLNPEGTGFLKGLLLGEGLHIHGIVDRDLIAENTTHFLNNPTAARGYAITSLLTFSAWLEDLRPDVLASV